MGTKPTYEELEQRVKELEQETVLHERAAEALQESEKVRTYKPLNHILNIYPFYLFLSLFTFFIEVIRTLSIYVLPFIILFL